MIVKSNTMLDFVDTMKKMEKLVGHFCKRDEWNTFVLEEN